MTSTLPRPATRAGLLPILAATVTAVLWASAFVGIRAVGRDFSPGSLTLGRQLVGSLALTLVVILRALRRGRLPTLPRGRLLVAVLGWGAAWFGLYNLALNTTERHLDAGTTALLVNLAPVLIVVLAGFLLGEGFSGRLIAGLVIAFTGVALIAATTWRGGGELLGVLCGLAAALLYAASATAQKRLLTRLDPLTLTWLGCLTGLVAAIPFGPELVRQAGAASAGAALGIAYLGVFPTATAFLTWGYALSHLPAGRLAASTYVIPPLVVLQSWLLLGEVPAPLAFLGGGLCLAGVAVATVTRVRRGRR